MLDAAQKLIPALALFAFFAIFSIASSFFIATHIQNESRDHQRDPLGPLVFSLALWTIIRELDNKTPNLIAVTERELCESLEILTHGNKCGLELGRDKFELWYTTCFHALDSSIKRNSQSEIEILGAAIGTPTFVASCLEKRVKKLEKVLDNLVYLEDPQCTLGNLRSCLCAPKILYSLRCNTPSPESKTGACLLLSKTGARIRRSLNQFKAAYVRSLSQSANIVEQITGVNPTHQSSFTDLAEEYSILGIPHLTQQNI